MHWPPTHNETLAKMATKNDQESKSFSFKFAKSKKSSKLPLENNRRTFEVKDEEADDIDYVVSTEGKEIRRYKSVFELGPFFSIRKNHC